MKAINNKKQTLEEVVEELIDLDHPLPKKHVLRKENKYLKEKDDYEFTKEVLVQRLRGQLRRYLSTPLIYSEQVEYISSKIDEIYEKYSIKN